MIYLGGSYRQFLAFVLLAAFTFGLAQGDPDNGNWDAENVELRNTGEAELMVRSGSINNVGFGFQEDENPFSAAQQWSHGYPWDPRPGAAEGTDRIMLGTTYTGEDQRDGYSAYWPQDPEGATTRPVVLEYDTDGLEIENALLQIVIDDFQAPRFGSRFTATINGCDAPFIYELINQVDQTGPVVQVISIQVPEAFLKRVASGSLSLFIDEAGGVGDGFAIDFVKLLVNYGRSSFVSSVEGQVLDDQHRPFAGATIRVLGTRDVITTDADGRFEAEVVSGLNAFRVSHDGYEVEHSFAVTPAGETVQLHQLVLHPGDTSPDRNYSYFAGGSSWEISSAWASPELDLADCRGLIPAVLAHQDLTQQITRAEFAAVVVSAYESLSGTLVSPAAHNPFTDTADFEVLRAFGQDLAVGISHELFDPHALLNREQAATMLTRVVKKMSFPDWTYATDHLYPLEIPELQDFADSETISPWARESVQFMLANGIISGLDDEAFRPRGVLSDEQAMETAGATREQALVLAVRLVESLRDR